MRRISDYRRQALAYPSIGVLNSSLMRLAHRAAEAIDQALAVSPGGLEDLATVQPAIAGCLQLNRQVGRFAKLECRLRSGAGATPISGPSAGSPVHPVPTTVPENCGS